MNKKGFAVSIILYSVVFIIVTILYMLLGVVRNRYMVNSELRQVVEHDVEPKQKAVITCNEVEYSGAVQTIATCSGGTIINASQINVGEYTVSCIGDANHENALNTVCSITGTLSCDWVLISTETLNDSCLSQNQTRPTSPTVGTRYTTCVGDVRWKWSGAVAQCNNGTSENIQGIFTNNGYESSQAAINACKNTYVCDSAGGVQSTNCATSVYSRPGAPYTKKTWEWQCS